MAPTTPVLELNTVQHVVDYFKPQKMTAQVSSDLLQLQTRRRGNKLDEAII